MVTFTGVPVRALYIPEKIQLLTIARIGASNRVVFGRSYTQPIFRIWVASKSDTAYCERRLLGFGTADAVVWPLLWMSSDFE
jgi:hypothetical protein